MKVILVDDETLSLEVLERQLKKIEKVEILGKYDDPQRAFQELQYKEVDVVFLDMEMAEFHGLELADKIVEKYQNIEIVFVTAHPQFALEAFEVNAIDYLLKPVNYKRLQKTIQKLQEKLDLYKNSKVKTDKTDIFYLQTMGAFQLYDSQNNIVKWRTRKVKELFIYLWHHRNQPIHRTYVLDDLWPELPVDKATTLMHTTVYQLRKTLKDSGICNSVQLVNEQYTLEMNAHSDFDELKSLLEKNTLQLEHAKNIVELYKGDYLEAEDYHWAVSVQKSMRNLFLNYLENYVLEENERYDFEQLCLEKMIQLEPYNEQYIYLLLDHYGKGKRIEKFISLFQTFKKRWINELGIDPPIKIMDLYNTYVIDDGQE